MILLQHLKVKYFDLTNFQNKCEIDYFFILSKKFYRLSYLQYFDFMNFFFQISDWCNEVPKVKVTHLQEVLTPGQVNEKIMKSIQEGIDRVNRQSVSNAQKIQKWTILPTDFSVPGDELGPTLKLKRHTVCKKYAPYIESLYDV